MEHRDSVVVQVCADEPKTEANHFWRYIGYDECNYTNTPGGEELLRDFGKLADAPYYIRMHHLLCTGNSRGTVKWGSTNVYTEDANHVPVYDFKVIDSILDTVMRTNNKPFFELGFMPMDLVDPKLFQNCDSWSKYNYYFNEAHTYPPKDYSKWYALIAGLVVHCVKKFGEAEVGTWYWELWNEPDLKFYWGGTVDDYCRLYDYTEAAVHSILPDAKLGGPATTGPSEGSASHQFLARFLEHCRDGVNYFSGKKGTRLDYITFHVKGGGFPFHLHAEKETPTVRKLCELMQAGLETVAKYGYGDREIVLSEADPDGWAAGGMYDNPNLSFRNTEYYATYIASSYHHIDKIAESLHMDVRPIAWAFMFPEERCFEGTRTFSTQGIKKASFHVFSLLSKMGDQRLELTSSREKDILSSPADELPEVSGMATRKEDGSVQVLLYSHHDDWDIHFPSDVELNITGLQTTGEVRIQSYCVDGLHSNAYEEWSRQGRPLFPYGEQYTAIRKKGELTTWEPSQTAKVENGSVSLHLSLSAHSIVYFEISKV